MKSQIGLPKPVINYLRVSTDRQGKSGLGLEAQQTMLDRFNADFGNEVIATFIEVETGKGFDALAKRPQLATALEIARLTGATIAAAKIDRITRNLEFGAFLFHRSGVAFKIAAMPHAGNLEINIHLVMAQHEAEMISQRTKEALAAARERGVVLGGGKGSAARRSSAVAFAAGLKAIVEPMLHLPSRAIAAALNAQGIKSATGGEWSSVTVLRLIERLGVPA